VTSIKITVSDAFIPERSYIIDTLFTEFLGLDYELIILPGSKDYCIKTDRGELIVRDHFFERFADESNYICQENIPSFVLVTNNPFLTVEDIPILYGDEEMDITTNRIVCGADLFASAFFMLTRWEEYANKSRDIHGRFPATASLAKQKNFLHRPIVNEYVEMLWAMLKHIGFHGLRKQRSFNMLATHDLDAPLRWDMVPLISFLKQ